MKKIRKLEPSLIMKIMEKIEDMLQSYRWEAEKKQAYRNKKIIVDLWIDYKLTTSQLINYSYSYLARTSSSGNFIKEIMAQQSNTGVMQK